MGGGGSVFLLLTLPNPATPIIPPPRICSSYITKHPGWLCRGECQAGKAKALPLPSSPTTTCRLPQPLVRGKPGFLSGRTCSEPLSMPPTPFHPSSSQLTICRGLGCCFGCCCCCRPTCTWSTKEPRAFSDHPPGGRQSVPGGPCPPGGTCLACRMLRSQSQSMQPPQGRWHISGEGAQVHEAISIRGSGGSLPIRQTQRPDGPPLLIWQLPF